MLAKTVFRCNNDTGSAVLEGLVDTGPVGGAWTQLNLTDVANDSEIGWGLGQNSISLDAFLLLDESAQPLDGVFLGNFHSATWAVKKITPDSGSDDTPYWRLRLLGADGDISADESLTFLKVTA